MEGCKRMVDIENDRSKNKKKKPPEDDFDFMLWKSELNSELLSFWRSITEDRQV